MQGWFTPFPLNVNEKQTEVSLPALTNECLVQIGQQLKNYGKLLRQMSVSDIANGIERVAIKWKDKNFSKRQDALSLLPKFLPFSYPTCERAIDALFENLTAERLLALLDEQLGNRNALDEFIAFGSGVLRRAFGAELASIILSGNIVGVGIWDIIFCLICKTPVLVKPSSNEPIMPVLFAQSFLEIVPELAKAVAVIPWSSDRTDLTDLALTLCDVVIVYGNDETVQQIKCRTPAKVCLIERGHRFSVGMIASDFADNRTADLLALDVARFDQRGCLSPQICFVEGREQSAKFAQKVAESLSRLNEELPLNLSEKEILGVTQFRLTCEACGATVFSSPDSSWTVALWDEVSDNYQYYFRIPCSNRVVHIVFVPSLEEAVNFLEPKGKFLQGVAIASTEDRAKKLAEDLGFMGASRICAVGALQIPPINWHQDGKHLIAELVRWCDLETIALPSFKEGWVELFFGEEAKAVILKSALEQRGIPISYESDILPDEKSGVGQRLLVQMKFFEEAKSVVEDALKQYGVDFWSEWLVRTS